MQAKYGFIQFPVKLLYDNRISDKARVLAAILIDIADAMGCAQVTIDQLRRMMNCNGEKTVRRAEAELCNAGYIEVRRTGRASMIWLCDELRTGRDWSAIRWYENELRKGNVQ